MENDFCLEKSWNPDFSTFMETHGIFKNHGIFQYHHGNLKKAWNMCVCAPKWNQIIKNKIAGSVMNFLLVHRLFVYYFTVWHLGKL